MTISNAYLELGASRTDFFHNKSDLREIVLYTKPGDFILGWQLSRRTIESIQDGAPDASCDLDHLAGLDQEPLDWNTQANSCRVKEILGELE
jgi:hypothetical protein